MLIKVIPGFWCINMFKKQQQSITFLRCVWWPRKRHARCWPWTATGQKARKTTGCQKPALNTNTIPHLFFFFLVFSPSHQTKITQHFVFVETLIRIYLILNNFTHSFIIILVQISLNQNDPVSAMWKRLCWSLFSISSSDQATDKKIS